MNVHERFIAALYVEVLVIRETQFGEGPGQASCLGQLHEMYRLCSSRVVQPSFRLLTFHLWVKVGDLVTFKSGDNFIFRE